MTKVLSECRRCRKQWPSPCRCEDGGLARPLTHPLRPADPAVEVHAELSFRGALYRVSGWFAEATYGEWSPTPGAVEIWKALDAGTRVLVDAPSFTLTKHALSSLRISFDVEMRRRNPDWMAKAFARREAGR